MLLRLLEESAAVTTAAYANYAGATEDAGFLMPALNVPVRDGKPTLAQAAAHFTRDDERVKEVRASDDSTVIYLALRPYARRSDRAEFLTPDPKGVQERIISTGWEKQKVIMRALTVGEVAQLPAAAVIESLQLAEELTNARQGVVDGINEGRSGKDLSDSHLKGLVKKAVTAKPQEDASNFESLNIGDTPDQKLGGELQHASDGMLVGAYYYLAEGEAERRIPLVTVPAEGGDLRPEKARPLKFDKPFWLASEPKPWSAGEQVLALREADGGELEFTLIDVDSGKEAPVKAEVVEALAGKITEAVGGARERLKPADVAAKVLLHACYFRAIEEGRESMQQAASSITSGLAGGDFGRPPAEDEW